MLMMSVMLGLWPASFSIAEHVANWSLHTKNHRLSRSDEPFRNTTGSVNLDPKNIRFGGQTVATLGQKKLEFWGQIWVPKWDRFLAPKIGIVAPPIKILIWGSYVGQKGASFGDQNRIHFWPHFWLKKQFFGQKTCQFRAIISGPNFCPPRISGTITLQLLCH